MKQLTTWQEINEDIPEFAKYHELIEELKKNKDIKGLQKFLADHILPVILNKNDQNVKKVISLLNERYGRTQTEKVEEAIEDLFKFREDQFEDDDELMLAMSELRKRRVDLEITFDEFHTVWMLQKLKKRRKMENFELQTLREVVKVNGPDVVKNFEEKFKEIRVEGKRKSLKDSTTLYTETLPTTYYTEAEQEQIETMYMGKESQSRIRYNNSRTRTPSQNGRPRSYSQTGYNGRPRTYSQNRYNPNDPRAKSPGRRPETQYQGRSRTPSRTHSFPPIRCITCRCNNCFNNKKTLHEIKDLLYKELYVKLVAQETPLQQM